MDVGGVDRNGFSRLSQSGKKRFASLRKYTSKKIMRSSQIAAKEEVNPKWWIKCFNESGSENDRNKIFKQFQKALLQSKNEELDVKSVFKKSDYDAKLFFLSRCSQSSQELFNSLRVEDALELVSKMPLDQALSFTSCKMYSESSLKFAALVERRLKRMDNAGAATSFSNLSEENVRSRLFEQFSFEMQFLLAGHECSGIKKQFKKIYRYNSKNNTELVLKVLARSIGFVPFEFIIKCIEDLPDRHKIKLLRFISLVDFKKIEDGYIPIFEKLLTHKKIISWLRVCAGAEVPLIFNRIYHKTKNIETMTLFIIDAKLRANILEENSKELLKEMWEGAQFFGLQSLITSLLKPEHANEDEKLLLSFFKKHKKFTILLKDNIKLANPNGQLYKFWKNRLDLKQAFDLLKLMDVDSRRNIYPNIMSIVLTYSSFTTIEALFVEINDKFFHKNTPDYVKRNIYELVSKLLKFRDVKETPFFIKDMLDSSSKGNAKERLLKTLSYRKRRLNYMSDNSTASTHSPRKKETFSDEVIQLFCRGFECSRQLNALVDDIKTYTLQLISNIGRDEFVTLKWLNSDSEYSNVKVLISEWNKLSDLTKDFIIKPELSDKRRSDMISFFIEVSQRLASVGDFHSSFAIYTALNSSESKHLKKAWEMVSWKYEIKISQLDQLFDINNNCINLRNKMRYFASQKKAYCFPINLISRDLENISANMGNWDGDHINYEKVNALSKQFMELHRCQMLIPMTKGFHLESDFQASLDAIETRKDYWRLSLECEPKG